MKLTRLFAFALAASLVAAPLAAESFLDDIQFSTAVDFAYYPDSAWLPGTPDGHFAPITGPYSGVEGRVTGNASYTIPTPLGENFLLKSANINLTGSLEIAPVSVKPQFSATFTPLPFLVFGTGISAGTGWNLAGLQGMALFDGTEYVDLTPFKDWYYKFYVQGTFQFDTGAIFAGDWTHAVIQYTYQAYYEGLSAAGATDLWEWQLGKKKTNGWQNYQSLILAYQMPLPIYRVGVMCELSGHYSDTDYTNPDFNGSFKWISVCPLTQFKFGEHDVLNCILDFSSRRCYATETTPETEVDATFVSREWYFNRIAFSWTHNF